MWPQILSFSDLSEIYRLYLLTKLFEYDVDTLYFETWVTFNVSLHKDKELNFSINDINSMFLTNVIILY